MHKALAWTMLLGLAGCFNEYEGDEAGECSDGADNDRDLLFDCFDPDCAMSPLCMGDADTNVPDPTDTQPPDTDDPGPDDTPPDTDNPPEELWDCPDRSKFPELYETRPPGPHTCEVDKVTAWLQNHASGTTSTSASCLDQTSDDWAGIFDRQEWDPSSFYYKFYKVEANLTVAPRQQCASGQYPNCTEDEDVTYFFDDDEDWWIAELDPTNVPVDQVPGCGVTLNQDDIIIDNGATGTLIQEIKITVTASCPTQLQINNGCTITHEYDLDFTAAE